jgi:hypothetical protein
MNVRWKVVAQTAYTMRTSNWWASYTAFGSVCSEDILDLLRYDHFQKAVASGIVYC